MANESISCDSCVSNYVKRIKGEVHLFVCMLRRQRADCVSYLGKSPTVERGKIVEAAFNCDNLLQRLVPRAHESGRVEALFKQVHIALGH